MSKKTSLMIILLSAIIVFIINIIFYQQLPNEVGLQITTSGNLRNQIPKLYFIFIAPIILMVNYLFGRLQEEDNLLKPLFITVIIIAVNLLTLVMNT